MGTEGAGVARYVAIEQWLDGLCSTLPAGSGLPTEAEVAERFHVSRMTARQAFQNLVQEGLIERRRGAGSFVLPRPLHRKPTVMRSFSQEMAARGLVASSRIVRAEVATAPEAAAAMGLPPADWMVIIERVRCADGLPVALERAVLPGRFAAVLEADLAQGSLHQALAALGRRIGQATGYVTARLATDEEAGLLGLDLPAALLVESRMVTDPDGTPIESTRTAYAGSRWVIDTGSYVPAEPPRSGSGTGPSPAR